MIVTGTVTLLFVLIHVKQFKYGAYYATGGATRSSAISIAPRSRSSTSRCGWPST